MAEQWGRITYQHLVGSFSSVPSLVLTQNSYTTVIIVNMGHVSPKGVPPAFAAAAGLWGWHTDVRWRNRCLLWGLSHFHRGSALAALWRQLLSLLPPAAS